MYAALRTWGRVRAFSRPMTHIPALKTGSWVPGVFRGSSAAVGKLHTNFVAHEMAFVILGDTFFRSLAAIEFHEAISDF